MKGGNHTLKYRKNEKGEWETRVFSFEKFK